MVDFITKEKLTEVLGGDEVVTEDKRLQDLLWQANIILDNKIMLQDFTYVLQFTDTVVQQQKQLDRVKRYIKKMREGEKIREKHDLQKLLQREKKSEYVRRSNETTLIEAPFGVQSLESSLNSSSLEMSEEKELELKVQEMLDDELLKEVKRTNKRNCFCFKRKIKGQLQDRVNDRLKDEKAENLVNFEWRAEKQKIDISRIKKLGLNKEVTEYGKIYQAKEHHGKFRQKLINLQNKYWADMPMTILGILCLFFIPLFEYCSDLIDLGWETSDS